MPCFRDWDEIEVGLLVTLLDSSDFWEREHVYSSWSFFDRLYGGIVGKGDSKCCKVKQSFIRVSVCIVWNMFPHQESELLRGLLILKLVFVLVAIEVTLWFSQYWNRIWMWLGSFEAWFHFIEKSLKVIIIRVGRPADMRAWLGTAFVVCNWVDIKMI